MKIYQVIIKKGKKNLARFEFIAEYADDAVEKAMKVFFCGKSLSDDELKDYSYSAQCLGECVFKEVK